MSDPFLLPVFVVAGDTAQYRSFLFESGANRQQAIRLTDSNQPRGRRGAHVIFYGTWQRSRMIKDPGLQQAIREGYLKTLYWDDSCDEREAFIKGINILKGIA